MTDKALCIGGASGFWGDAARATSQLLNVESLDYLVYDYLAEITMSIMARARAKDDSRGYAIDFVTAAMKPNLAAIAQRGIKVVSNAGGVNPQACAAALCAEIEEQGLNLTVACITGDDLLTMKEQLAASGVAEMFSGAAFPVSDSVLSINAYLGAFPIARALQMGADIVITGRCVDSAVTLGACIHAFGWDRSNYDLLAMGSLAGHILECGTQATGGNFTDWEQVSDMATMGYPVAEVSADGSFVVTKPPRTGGLINAGTVSEQMLYEIGDPQAYVLPDVTCDFSTATIEEIGKHRVRVSGATGRIPPDTYKVSCTYADAFRGGTYLSYYGLDADKKARVLGDAIFQAARNRFKVAGLPDFIETSVEVMGAESQFGDFSTIDSSREVVMKLAAKHSLQAGIGIMLKETVGLALAAPPGLSGFAGSRPAPSPVVRLFSFAVAKAELRVQVALGNHTEDCKEAYGKALDIAAIARPEYPTTGDIKGAVDVPLIKLAWARSGDKGDKANIGIIARRPEYLPYICASITESAVQKRFDHFLENSDNKNVERFLLPGSNALNFLLHDVLGGGGVASIRNDPQGKGYAQLLLSCPVTITSSMAESLS